MSRDVDVDASAAWSVLIDTRRWPDWGPTVAGVEAAPLPLQLGTTGRVRTAVGVWLDFEVTEFVPGRSWSWKVAGIHATDHRVETLGPGRCRIAMSAPWAAAPYLAVCAIALRRIGELAHHTS